MFISVRYFHTFNNVMASYLVKKLFGCLFQPKTYQFILSIYLKICIETDISFMCSKDVQTYAVQVWGILLCK